MAKFLDTTTPADIKKPSILITLSSTTTIADALQTLRNNHINSAPVLDGARFIGFVDNITLLRYLIDTVDGSSSELPSKILKTIDIADLTAKSRDFNLTNLKSSKAVSLSRWHPINNRDTLDIAKILFAKGVQRLPVRDAETGMLIDILSQSDIIKYLAKHGIGEIRKRTVKSLDLGTKAKDLPSITADTITIDAFYKMLHHHVGALPIVAEDGKLVGNLSASDMKAISNWQFKSLLLPVGQFLKEVAKVPDRVVSVREDSTLEKVVELMGHESISRVYIVDEAGKLEGVISQTDIFKVLAYKE